MQLYLCDNVTKICYFSGNFRIFDRTLAICGYIMLISFIEKCTYENDETKAEFEVRVFGLIFSVAMLKLFGKLNLLKFRFNDMIY